jgi:hypothetical protein
MEARDSKVRSLLSGRSVGVAIARRSIFTADYADHVMPPFHFYLFTFARLWLHMPGTFHQLTRADRAVNIQEK